ncbi:hypothetical protein SAM23877_6509 [Streptomyces ambofaciens ATCC 23877]|uniref:Uncharacterized protein n=1 Tax=Streptomyces ambofaciens (strain ATCC 23877 / 3486 / DSM 40053 / JCM 4204 / NBRC 12836 / NRRL B-2516) TaxID=278992 RepID=A0AE63_STRA7|nr:hypothetical protein [Streptomyces ambofaciens]AKZ59554.1 hypothetical protein SAM23877_6509 [Streptomyces ambofaciens ATCC 23877]CAJ88772.1 conserved hypothetical protein [Streptomyces ambofaciens ATCC 23877]
MTDDTERPAAPRALSPRDEARVQFAHEANELAELALALLPIDPDAPRGDRLRRALSLRARLDHLVAGAVIAEREEGTTWAQLAAAAGMSRQAAHERWSGDVTTWASLGRTMHGRASGFNALDAAARLDRVYARRMDDQRGAAVSSGLDAVRFPGAVAAERARRERAADLHHRLEAITTQYRASIDRLKQLTDDRADPGERAAVLRRRAVLQDQMSDLYDDLTGAEPELADEHRATCERYRADATADREYADLLQAKSATRIANDPTAGDW